MSAGQCVSDNTHHKSSIADQCAQELSMQSDSPIEVQKPLAIAEASEISLGLLQEWQHLEACTMTSSSWWRRLKTAHPSESPGLKARPAFSAKAEPAREVNLDTQALAPFHQKS